MNVKRVQIMLLDFLTVLMKLWKSTFRSLKLYSFLKDPIGEKKIQLSDQCGFLPSLPPQQNITSPSTIDITIEVFFRL